jgi:hypothetical protein
VCGSRAKRQNVTAVVCQAKAPFEVPGPPCCGPFPDEESLTRPSLSRATCNIAAPGERLGMDDRESRFGIPPIPNAISTSFIWVPKSQDPRCNLHFPDLRTPRQRGGGWSSLARRACGVWLGPGLLLAAFRRQRAAALTSGISCESSPK